MARNAPFREPDLTRAITAATKAGLREFRVEIADGVISIIVGATERAAPAVPNSCDDLLD